MTGPVTDPVTSGRGVFGRLYHGETRADIVGRWKLWFALSGVVLLPGSYLLMYHIGWINSYLALVVPGAVSVFGMFLFMQAMRQVPDELLQAGRIDGCSELRLWWEIALPIVRPMIGAFTLLTFLASWNSYLWPLIVLTSTDKQTLQVVLGNMNGMYKNNEHVLMAGAVLTILPILAVYLLSQRKVDAGIALGGLK